ncbi:hypothetical protein KW841_06795 [Pseudomonas sp. PDM28]|uniref:DUF6864 domain-containing function n=1 Tax=Pseudomonas sp. PDM28 TaxID=2854770 RepID=UPI001C4917B8|nr:hypothetical protein [Pseudomonas sp. PDM28]MBV7552056.1 hypothetical protein [Pseudomonas sp. PDM28]
MAGHEVFVGSNEVLASGSVVVPKDQNTVSIKLQDLTFRFVFLYDGSTQKISYSGGGQLMTINLTNPPQMKWVGRTRDFLPVGTLGEDKIGLAYFIYAAKNLSHMVKYTIVKLDSDSVSLAEEVGDE